MINLFRKEERNVEEKSKKETVRISRLTIKFLDGSSLSWTHLPYVGKGVITPWLSFYKWYMYRKSDSYAMKYKTGITALRRDQIQWFNIEIKEEVK